MPGPCPFGLAEFTYCFCKQLLTCYQTLTLCVWVFLLYLSPFSGNKWDLNGGHGSNQEVPVWTLLRAALNIGNGEQKLNAPASLYSGRVILRHVPHNPQWNHTLVAHGGICLVKTYFIAHFLFPVFLFLILICGAWDILWNKLSVSKFLAQLDLGEGYSNWNGIRMFIEVWFVIMKN